MRPNLRLKKPPALKSIQLLNKMGSRAMNDTEKIYIGLYWAMFEQIWIDFDLLKAYVGLQLRKRKLQSW